MVLRKYSLKFELEVASRPTDMGSIGFQSLFHTPSHLVTRFWVNAGVVQFSPPKWRINSKRHMTVKCLGGKCREDALQGCGNALLAPTVTAAANQAPAQPFRQGTWLDCLSGGDYGRGNRASPHPHSAFPHPRCTFPHIRCTFRHSCSAPSRHVPRLLPVNFSPTPQVFTTWPHSHGPQGPNERQKKTCIPRGEEWAQLIQ